MMSCETAREHLSARADAAWPPDPASEHHVVGCAACRAWQAGIAELAAQTEAAFAVAPDATRAAVAAFEQARGRAPAPRVGIGAGQLGFARGLLVAAGMAGVLVSLAALIGTGWAAPLSSHLGRDLAGLQGALAAGFLLAAWRPARYGRALLPVAAAAALLTVLPGAADATRAAASLLVEAAHLPLLAGAAGLLLVADGTGGLAPRRSQRA